MHSKNRTGVQDDGKRSFIEEARRAQILQAAMDVVAEQGSSQASLAKIAERTGISTSLILYHFKNKEELMSTLLESITTEWQSSTEKAIARHTSASAKLKSYIETRMAYIGTRPKQSIVMVDLLFALKPGNDPQAYRTHEQGFELTELIELLTHGQKAGEFKSFDVSHMAIMIRSTIDQFLGYSQVPGINLEQYLQDVLAWYGQLIAKKGTL